MSSDEARPARRLAVLATLFFLSGVSGLIYQVVWFRMLARAFGVTVFAVTTVLVVFMSGLALGSFAASRLSPSRPKLLIYGALEVAVAITAGVSSALMLKLPEMFGPMLTSFGASGAAITALRVLASSIVLLPPTFLMGATLPVLSAHVTQSRGARGTESGAGLLYGVNTLGAVVGVLLSGFVLIAALGERGTIILAVSLSLAVGAVSFALVARGDERREYARPTTEKRGGARRVLVVAFLSGVCALSFEVVWFRILTLLLGNSVYGFSCMLAAYLVGVGIGSVVMARSVSSLTSPERALGVLELTIALTSLASLEVFLVIGLGHAEPRYAYGLIWNKGDFVSLIVSSLFIVLPATLAYGAFFPVAVRLAREGSQEDDALVVGRLYAATTLGNIVGSLLTGFVLVPTLGTRTTFLTMAAASFSIGVYLVSASSSPRRGTPRSVVALATLFAVTMVVTVVLGDPFVKVLLLRAGPEKGTLVAHEEDRGATLSLFRDQRGERTLYINGLYVSNTGPLLGEGMLNFPLAFDPDPGPKRVLAVGLGVGEVLRYAVDAGHDITIAELQRDVVELFRRFSPDAERYLTSPRSHIALADGRNYLLGTRDVFDLILVDGSPPVYASGMVNLYSRELASLARAHLAPDGAFVIWFPVICFDSDFWMLVRTLSEVFPEVAVYSPKGSSNAMLMGARGPSGRFAVDVPTLDARLGRFLSHPPLTGASLAAGMYLSNEELRRRAASYPAVTDDHPYTELPLGHFLAGDPYYRDNRFLYAERK